jgi:hypothetical protein
MLYYKRFIIIVLKGRSQDLVYGKYIFSVYCVDVKSGID